MSFCPECGIDHHAAERAEADAAKAETDRAVEIARLETKRDIEVARINAGAATAISETEAEADVARAEGIAEGMETVIDSAAPDAPEPGGDPIIVTEPAPEPEPESEPVPDVPPPPEAGPVARHGKSKGWFSNYS